MLYINIKGGITITGIEELKKKLENHSELAKALESAADDNELLQKIKEAGIDVTFEEIAEAVSAEGELDDSALVASAGGYMANVGVVSALSKLLKKIIKNDSYKKTRCSR